MYSSILIMDVWIVLSVGVLLLFCHRRFRDEEELSIQELNSLERLYQDLLSKKDHVLEERTKVEREAHKLFALYDFTKEMTNLSSPEEAFDLFKSKLRENIIFEDCLWLPPDVSVESLRLIEEDSFLVPLMNDKETIARLLFKKVAVSDREKVIILSQQFALVLRRIILYQKIDGIAIADSLTGVYTRRYFLERFEEEIQRSRMRKANLSFLMMDVDFFKSFNDQYGHLTGDQILKEMGSIIKANIREIDIAGRYGGEEFCVVLPDTDNAGALLAAERIRSSVENTPIKAYDQVLKVTLSIGISTFPSHGKISGELLDKADWALYRAKKSGRNRVCSFGLYEEKGS